MHLVRFDLSGFIFDKRHLSVGEDDVFSRIVNGDVETVFAQHDEALNSIHQLTNTNESVVVRTSASSQWLVHFLRFGQIHHGVRREPTASRLMRKRT